MNKVQVGLTGKFTKPNDWCTGPDVFGNVLSKVHKGRPRSNLLSPCSAGVTPFSFCGRQSQRTETQAVQSVNIHINTIFVRLYFKARYISNDCQIKIAGHLDPGAHNRKALLALFSDLVNWILHNDATCL